MSTESPRPTQSHLPLVLACSSIAVVIAVLFGFVHYSAGYNEVRVSIFAFARAMWKLEDWQHCILVPIAAGVIIYLQRKTLATLPVKGSWWGFPMVVTALAIFWFGYEADIVYFGYASAQILLAGLIIFFLGWQWMLALAFPWLFLLFMWPLLFLGDQLAFPLRIVMSKASVLLLNLLGVHSMLQGTALLSAPDVLSGKPAGTLFEVDVADACSGIRSLFALMMVSALFAHFGVKGWWKKWIVFLCSMPLAVIGNMCRIVMLVFGTLVFGSEVAIGTEKNPSFFHMLAGYLVFLVALGGLFLVIRMLHTDWRTVWVKAQRGLTRPASGGTRPPAGTRAPDVY